MSKEEILKILENAKDKNSDVPMRLVRQAFEKLPEPCEDAVSRQRLLSDLKKLVAAWKKYPVMAEEIKGVEAAIAYVELIPSVKPNSKELSETHKALDTISRQAAIDAMTDTIWHYPNECYRNLNVYEFARGLAELGLKSVPPAQTEQESFEWCHDCKEYDQEQHCCHRWTKTIRKTVDELKQSAQQGTWQQCYITTPMGGQHCVWECDGCGARVAERTKYCAECGRRMT